jgi:hypothetical protein
MANGESINQKLKIMIKNYFKIAWRSLTKNNFLPLLILVVYLLASQLQLLLCW